MTTKLRTEAASNVNVTCVPTGLAILGPICLRLVYIPFLLDRLFQSHLCMQPAASLLCRKQSPVCLLDFFF